MYIGLILEEIIPYITGILEIIGVTIIAVATIRSVFSLIRGRFNFNYEYYKIEFVKALALSLEFKLAAEILKTIIVRSLDEFVILAFVTFLRIIISFVIHWEIKCKKKEDPTDEDFETQAKEQGE